MHKTIPSAAVLVMANMLMAIIWSKLDLLIAEDVGYSNRVSNSPMSWYCNVGNLSILSLSNRQILFFYSSRISSQTQFQNFSQEWRLLIEGRHLIEWGGGWGAGGGGKLGTCLKFLHNKVKLNLDLSLKK